MPDWKASSTSLQDFKSLSSASDFEAIMKFLVDEAEVTTALNELLKLIDTSNFDAFDGSLRVLEGASGFKEPWKTSEGGNAVSAFLFLSQIKAKKPVDDVGLKGLDHGRSTHRVQWMMIAHHFKSGLSKPIVDLYEMMGNTQLKSPTLLKDGREEYLWDRLVDALGD